LRVRILPGLQMSVSCECCVLSEVSATDCYSSRGFPPIMACLNVVAMPRY
jgi:hypothetical protein